MRVKVHALFFIHCVFSYSRETCMGKVSTYNWDIVQDDEEVLGSLHQLVTHQVTYLERKRNCKNWIQRYLYKSQWPLPSAWWAEKHWTVQQQPSTPVNRQCDCESTSDDILHRRGKRPYEMASSGILEHVNLRWNGAFITDTTPLKYFESEKQLSMTHFLMIKILLVNSQQSSDSIYWVAARCATETFSTTCAVHVCRRLWGLVVV